MDSRDRDTSDAPAATGAHHHARLHELDPDIAGACASDDAAGRTTAKSVITASRIVDDIVSAFLRLEGLPDPPTRGRAFIR